MTIVKAALLQTDWAGDQASMIDKHEEAAREAAAQGAQVMCFQELFYGPYFCQVQDAEYYSYTEPIPDGPTTQAVPVGGQGARHGDRAADVRDRAGRPVLQHRRRDRRRRHLPGQVPQAPHPAGEGVLGEVLLHARHRGVPGLRDRGRQGRRLHLLRPPLPGGLADARPARRRDRVQPLGHPPRALRVPLAPGAARRRRREHVLRGRDQPRGDRAARRERLLRAELLRGSGGPVRRRAGRRLQARADRARPGPGQDPRGARPLGVLPRPPARRLRRHRAPGEGRWTSASSCRPPRRARGWSTWRRRRRPTGSATCGRSTATCCGRSRSRSSRRSWRTPATWWSARWSRTRSRATGR